ncbi:MAG: aldehyde dehydrogenase family protein [Deltaproteobacteria bacterium]|jgi:malonate-semialdehyde dehydrogenase (acetylating)/methylmalonate-semialdehyde dehydrogenase|nr:aldehyde dehydrogenase family protein [Deltaproteobacteria bacterium]
MTILPEVQKHYGKLKFYINGKWVDSKSDLIYKDVNPATGEVIAEFPSATDDEIEAAILSAQAALSSWREVPLRDKARCLFDLRGKFEEHFDRLCRVLVQDHGRTIGEARGTLRRCIENIESACSALLLLTKGECVMDLAKGLDQALYWEPRGVFLIITPNNIPMHAWSSYVPYALASGCPVVVSPSKNDPVCLDAIFKVTEEVEGFPPGLVNLVHGGSDVNQKILSHPLVKGVGFIGSTAVGKELFALAGKLGKEASINGNGKNHVVIMPDCNVDAVVSGLLRGCYGMAGQRCLGTDNLLFAGQAYEAVKERLIEASANMKLGYGLDEATELGPMVSERGRQKVMDFIEKGVSQGAVLALDGRGVTVPGGENGFFLAPTVLDGVEPDMFVARQEAFGPVINLMRIRDLDEGLDWINNKDAYGHSACIFTRDGYIARKFMNGADVGNIRINVPVPQPFAFFPLGSKNESALGVAKSRIDSLRLFLDQKTVTERWA